MRNVDNKTLKIDFENLKTTTVKGLSPYHFIEKIKIIFRSFKSVDKDLFMVRSAAK